MLRLIVLLAAITAVCCHACRFEENPQDTTNSPGCTDSDGNLHEFNTDWDNEDGKCVCFEYGIICCKGFDHTHPDPTAEIFYDNFGAITENDVVETEEPSIDEEQVPNQPDSSDSPEVIGDSAELLGVSPEVIGDDIIQTS